MSLSLCHDRAKMFIAQVFRHKYGVQDMVSQMVQNSITCIFVFNDLYLFWFSTRYICVQQLILIFNNLHLYSTSAQSIFIQQLHLFNSIWQTLLYSTPPPPQKKKSTSHSTKHCLLYTTLTIFKQQTEHAFWVVVWKLSSTRLFPLNNKRAGIEVINELTYKYKSLKANISCGKQI